MKSVRSAGSVRLANLRGACVRLVCEVGGVLGSLSHLEPPAVSLCLLSCQCLLLVALLLF